MQSIFSSALFRAIAIHIDLSITRRETLSWLALSIVRHALARYRQRWTIEAMFGNLKTQGLALAVTHLTDPDKLRALVALLAFAVALAVKTD